MEWLDALFSIETLALVIPVIVIIGVFVVATVKSHRKHLERIAEIENSYIPKQK
jgi:hypothetical protein